MNRSENDSELERQADYRMFTLSGNHYDMGRQWAMTVLGQDAELVTEKEATEAAKLLGLSIDQLAVLDMDDEPARRQQVEERDLTSSQLTFARDCLQVACNYHPPLMDEFEGWADALGVSVDSLLGMLSFGMDAGGGNCSAFAWRGRHGVIVGRNYDFFYWARIRHLIRAEPVAYYASVGMNDGLVGGRHDGLNEQGLFVALNRVVTKPPTHVRPGIIFHLVPRILLETCSTAGEAAMLAREMPHLMSYSYLIADPQDMLVVEAYPGWVRVRHSENGYVAVTNHFLHPDLEHLVRSPIRRNSEERLATLLSSLQEADSDCDGMEMARRILTDHETPICGHTDGLATLWSVMADLAGQQLTYSLGAPCRNQYRAITWPGQGLGEPGRCDR